MNIDGNWILAIGRWPRRIVGYSHKVGTPDRGNIINATFFNKKGSTFYIISLL
jgi:hypothetical protein